MKYSFKTILIFFVIVLSIFMQAFGGMSDIADYRYWISREHLWADALYLLILAIVIHFVL
jgi:hypothetical protein